MYAVVLRLLLLLLVCSGVSPVLSKVYHITPSSSNPCPLKPCLTLSQFVVNPNEYVDYNTTLIFQSTNHILESELLIANISMFSMLSSSSKAAIRITCNQFGRFIINSIHTLHVSDLTFVGCSGNKVESVYEFILKDSTFIGQKDIFGTALDLVEVSATIYRSSFSSNRGMKLHSLSCKFDHSYQTFRVGGAIALLSSSITIVQSRFDGNSAEVGGAIFSSSNNTINIIGTSFTENYAVDVFAVNCQAGGGVFYIANNSIVTIQNSQFINNSALSENVGGVLYAKDGANDITIINCQFINNSVLDFGDGGGVMYIADGLYKIMISHSQFINNWAKYDGGVFMMTSYHFMSEGSLRGSTLVITDSEFINNFALFDRDNHGGGVLFVSDGVSKVSFVHTRFINNFAVRDGGVVYLAESVNTAITHSHFFNNSAHHNGGVISAERRNSIIITHSEFINDFANCSGAVIYAVESTNMSITHSRFINNSVSLTCCGDGGVASVYSVEHIAITCSQFINNSACSNGGVMRIVGSAVFITESNFMGNKASNGGVVYTEDANIKINDSRFDYNKAHQDGGVWASQKGSITIYRSSYDSNSAGHNGGVITISQRGIITLYEDNIFHGNSAGDDGGVLVLQQGSITVYGGNFDNNSAGHDGGVLAIQQESTLTVHGGNFDRNSADHDGGVMVSREGSINILGGNFVRNLAHHDGGVFQIFQGTLLVSNNMYNNNMAMNDGGVMQTYQSTTIISECSLNMNSATNDGGAVSAYQGSLSISKGTSFSCNIAHNDGGAIHSYELDLMSIGNSFSYNKAWNRGGAWFMYQHNVTITQSIISYCEAADGGVLYAYQGNIAVQNTSFVRNRADKGGAMHTDQITMSINHSSFSQNSASQVGGAWFVQEGAATLQHVSFTSNSANSGGATHISSSNILLNNCTFKRNIANNNGGAIHLSKTKLNSFHSLLIHDNNANVGVIYLLGSTAILHDETEFSGNSGSLLLFNSNATFVGTVRFVNSSEPIRLQDTADTIVQEGGALTVVMSKVFFAGTGTLISNYANYGGAIHASESEMYVNGQLMVANNTANYTGGGIYLHVSGIICLKNSSVVLLNNIATDKGGGLHAISSSIKVYGNFAYNHTSVEVIYLGSLLNFTGNKAKKGGGLCLETNAKLYILKLLPCNESISIINFTDNSADYGGAVYVSDDSNLQLCAGNYTSHYKAKECFFQISAIYDSEIYQKGVNTQNIIFSQNHAMVSGSSLFGGLLDRCKLHYFTEFENYSHTYSLLQNSQGVLVRGISYIINISNVNVSDISSEPVKLCFCKDNLPDCMYEPDPVRVTKGKRFFVDVVATDQVNHPVIATIHSHLLRTGGGLGKGQATQTTNKTCSKLTFNLFSPNDKEELMMYAEGPCVNSPQCTRRLTIQFTACDSCPIGFEKHVDETTVCECICDSMLQPYITKCNASTEQLERRGSFWITYINASNDAESGYLIYAHCPLNYCKPPTSVVKINLNIPDGANLQCANGHSGMLCGTCQANLSLSLGSSRCIPCSTKWSTITVIIIAAILAGIALVTLLLVLNLTVAVGTLNGIMFYANVLAANGSTFLPFSSSNFATVFISWLNLEIGFDTVCFFEGMDAYWKTLLQLTFPTYVILLVFMMIFISEHSTKFARLVAKKNPVATLATLILLSYTKFLDTVINSLSFAILIYPDGSHQRVWLPDATVKYLRGKHIILFVIAILILFAGIIYTTLLFCWQWLLRYQNKKFFAWIRYQKLCHFIEPYHAPYTFEQRYWTGLLLFVRVIIYIISAVNITGDPKISLVSINILVGLLLLAKGVSQMKIYKVRCVDVMELIIYFNIVAFATVTLQTETTEHQISIAYSSISVTFILLVIVMLFHVFRYTCLFTVIKVMKTSIVKFQENRKNRCTKQTCSAPNEEEDSEPLITHSVVELPVTEPNLEQDMIEVVPNNCSAMMVHGPGKIEFEATVHQSDLGKDTDAGTNDKIIQVSASYPNHDDIDDLQGSKFNDKNFIV